jgi:hypothetical protein
VDGSVEATKYACFYEGDPAKIKSMGDSRIVRGNVSNAQPDPPRLPPSIFTSVRLVRRVPVGVGIDQVRDVVRPVASITATVQVDPRPQQPARPSTALSELAVDRAWLRVGLSDAHRVGICSVEAEPIVPRLTAGYQSAWGYSNGAGQRPSPAQERTWRQPWRAAGAGAGKSQKCMLLIIKHFLDEQD